MSPTSLHIKSFIYNCETALLCVQNDIRFALDGRQCVVLLLLDLSAAFDTVEHNILLQRMSNKFGIEGKALDWLRSYLTERSQFVNFIDQGLMSVT